MSWNAKFSFAHIPTKNYPSIENIPIHFAFWRELTKKSYIVKESNLSKEERDRKIRFQQM